MDFINFSLKDYYLWTSAQTSVPWKRQHLNQEFLNYEQKRINDLVEWRTGFLKAVEGQSLKEVYFYTIPVELHTFWKGAIAEKGNYNYVGLSGLQNSPQVLAVALIPQDLKQPLDYRLIRIVRSKKSYITNTRFNLIQPVIIIEEWESLNSDKIYLDVPHEKSHVQKLIKENLIGDENTSLSFQSPLMSSPHVSGSIGGISLSSMSANGLFSQELIKTILRMTPPEYRGMKPPKRAYTGGRLKDIQGIKFHFAERPYFDDKYVSSFFDTSKNKLKNEINKRNKFHGEYSIFSTITPIYSNSTSIWNELLKSFTDTEITLPENLEDLRESDVDLTRMNKAITEDLWIQIVSSRQLNPPIDREASLWLNQTSGRLRKDFDALLSDAHKEDIQKDFIIRSMSHPTKYNIKRLAQSFARAENRDRLSEFDFSKARNLIVDNFYGFISHPNFEGMQSYIKKKKSDARFSVVETDLINNPKSTIQEIYDSIKSTGLFKDLTDLQGLLDWAYKKGFIWLDHEKRCSWV
ncbi:hypothetical protein KAR52_01045 [Candidatus Pacearchaeota archaeon]|nr:hypothetical protein [Candidatus Pacearchaeota archaeon]